ncbi:MAG TPA: 1-acyl-sn-glycerol-3-phosphate acyltransferase [bacterium]|nr:1-acyl-sn-glycerol-3-phosphate acyltransferase [bacterium]
MEDPRKNEFEKNVRAMAEYRKKFARYNRRRRAFFRAFFKYYHRLEIIGQERIPDGPALIVANHSGGLDLDIVALSLAGGDRDIHVLIVENWHFLNSRWGRYYVGGGIPLWTRGGIRYEYIDPYLRPGGENYPGLVAIYPEGDSGTFRERHLLQPFFTGVVRIALHYRVPLVPVAQIGFHNACPIVWEIQRDHYPNDPICPLFPLPAKLKIEFGEPFTLEQFYGRDLSREEQNWIANQFIRPRLAEVIARHHPVEIKKAGVPMQEPALKPRLFPDPCANQLNSFI